MKPVYNDCWNDTHGRIHLTVANPQCVWKDRELGVEVKILLMDKCVFAVLYCYTTTTWILQRKIRWSAKVVSFWNVLLLTNSGGEMARRGSNKEIRNNTTRRQCDGCNLQETSPLFECQNARRLILLLKYRWENGRKSSTTRTSRTLKPKNLKNKNLKTLKNFLLKNPSFFVALKPPRSLFF